MIEDGIIAAPPLHHARSCLHAPNFLGGVEAYSETNDSGKSWKRKEEENTNLKYRNAVINGSSVQVSCFSAIRVQRPIDSTAAHLLTIPARFNLLDAENLRSCVYIPTKEREPARVRGAIVGVWAVVRAASIDITVLVHAVEFNRGTAPRTRTHSATPGIDGCP